MAIKENSQEETDLETLVDAHSLSEVLEALVRIADGKAAHLASTWQDTTTSKSWTLDARRLEACATRLEN